MKTIKKLVMVLVAATVMVCSTGVFAQTQDAAANKTRQRLATKSTDPASASKEDAKSKPNMKLVAADPSGDPLKQEENHENGQTTSATKTSLPAAPDDSQANRHE